MIQDIFGKDCPADVKMDVMPSKEKNPDFLINVEEHASLLECQSCDNASMALRIAKYAFLVARQSAD